MSNGNNTLFMPYGSVNITFHYGDLHTLTRTVPEQTPGLAAPQIKPLSPPLTSSEPVDLPPLSPRQRQVLRLLVQGRSNKEIARTLGLAVGTVKIHTATLFSRMGVRGRTAAAVAGAKLLVLKDQPTKSRSAEDPTAKGTYPFGPCNSRVAA